MDADAGRTAVAQSGDGGAMDTDAVRTAVATLASLHEKGTLRDALHQSYSPEELAGMQQLFGALLSTVAAPRPHVLALPTAGGCTQPGDSEIAKCRILCATTKERSPALAPGP